jgi:hypothetical protein
MEKANWQAKVLKGWPFRLDRSATRGAIENFLHRWDDNYDDELTRGMLFVVKPPI